MASAVNLIGLATGVVLGGAVAQKVAEDLPVILKNSKDRGDSKPEPKTQPKAQPQPQPQPKQPKKYTEKDAAKDTGVKLKEVAQAWHDARDHAMNAGLLPERQVRKNTNHMSSAVPDSSLLNLGVADKTTSVSPTLHCQPPRHHYQPPPPSVQPFATSNGFGFKFSF